MAVKLFSGGLSTFKPFIDFVTIDLEVDNWLQQN